jgi:hypothetical protein
MPRHWEAWRPRRLKILGEFGSAMPSEVGVSSRVQSPMSQQLRANERLTRRLAAEWRRIVVLERLARAGGATRWFLISGEAMLHEVLETFGGGSSVSFYFADQLRVEVDDDGVRQVMFDEITRRGELVLGYPARDSPQLDMAIISGPSELTEYLMVHPEGSLAVWGDWPTRQNDGVDAITVDLVDADGVLRMHPH